MSHHVDFITLAKSVSKTLHLSYTLQLFFTTATTFSTVLYMGNDFHNNVFKIKKPLCVKALTHVNRGDNSDSAENKTIT